MRTEVRNLIGSVVAVVAAIYLVRESLELKCVNAVLDHGGVVVARRVGTRV